MKGRKSRPVAFRVIEGNPGRRPLPKAVRLDPIGDPPDYLDATARAEWLRVVDELAPSRILTRPDRPALACYCCAYSHHVTAEGHIQQLGGTMLVRTGSGTVMQSPWVGISNRAMELMHKFIIEFGMTPSSRARVSAAASDEKENSFAQIG